MIADLDKENSKLKFSLKAPAKEKSEAK